VLILDKLSWLFVGFYSYVRISVALLRFDGGLSGRYSLLFLDFRGGILRNVIQNALRTEILDSTLGIDATIQHADEIVSAREDELYVVSD
jgi:hypothetical protein